MELQAKLFSFGEYMFLPCQSTEVLEMVFGVSCNINFLKDAYVLQLDKCPKMVSEHVLRSGVNLWSWEEWAQ